jgi:hypothetical protein
MIAGILARLRSDLAEDLSALTPSRWRVRASPAAHWRGGILLAMSAFILYLALGLRLGAGAFFLANNFAFDFDPSTYIGLLFGDGTSFNALRHPLLVMLRPVCQVLLFIGLPTKIAVSVFFAATGALTVLVGFAYMLRFGIPLFESLLMSGFLAISSTPLFLALIPDSYGLSGLGLSLLYLVTLQRRDDAARHLGARFVLGLYLFGITASNIVQAGIAEIFLWFRHLPWLQALARIWSYCLLLGVLLVLAILARIDLASFLHDPVLALKHIYWAGSLPGEEQASLGDLVRTFFAYSFIAPEFTAVPMPNGEPTMLDFRDLRMNPIAEVALVLWLSLLISGFVAALRDQSYRFLFLILTAVILINVVLHVHMQYRASVYLYAAHLHFAIFAVALFAVRDSASAGGPRRWMSAIGLTALVGFAGCNNLLRALELVTSFG